jgi:hypothetical protein
VQSTLPLGRYEWLNTVYEISRMQALVPEVTELVPVERCFAHPSGSHNGPAIRLAVTASSSPELSPE